MCSEILPFSQINKKMFIPKGNLNKPTDALINLINQLNNFTDDEKENELNCKYRDPYYCKNLTKGFKRKARSFFHINVCSRTKNFDDFNILQRELNISFDIIAITESRIKKHLSSPINLQVNNYSIKHTTTESSAGETLLYRNKRLSYQLRNDLRIYEPGKSNQLL